jgi:hypothetical protein
LKIVLSILRKRRRSKGAQDAVESPPHIVESGCAGVHLRESLDEFYLKRQEDREDMLSSEQRLTGNRQYDAFLAATAEKLSDDYNLPALE